MEHLGEVDIGNVVIGTDIKKNSRDLKTSMDSLAFPILYLGIDK